MENLNDSQNSFYKRFEENVIKFTIFTSFKPCFMEHGESI